MASWLIICGSLFGNITPYNKESKVNIQEDFYEIYKNSVPLPNICFKDKISTFLNTEPCRLDLIPAVTIRKLKLYCELFSVKHGSAIATKWLKEGFSIDSKI